MPRRGRFATSSRPPAGRSTISASIKRSTDTGPSGAQSLGGSEERVVEALVVRALVFQAMAGAMLARDEAPAGAQFVDVARQVIDRLDACAAVSDPTGCGVDRRRRGREQKQQQNEYRRQPLHRHRRPGWRRNYILP